MTRATRRPGPRRALGSSSPSLLVALAALLLARPAHAEWGEWRIDAALESRFDSNLNRASRGSEEDWDVGFRPSAELGRVLQLADRTRLSASGRVGGEIYSRFDRLDAVEGSARLALFHKFGLGDAPWAQLSASGGYQGVRDARRGGPRFTLGAVGGKRLSPRIDATLGYHFSGRYGDDGPPVAGATVSDDVFDQQAHWIELALNALLSDQVLLGAGFGWRRGDFDSNARANRMQILAERNVRAVAQDQVFGGWVYRLHGNAYSPFVRMSAGLGDHWSFELGYRFQHGEGSGLGYDDHSVQGAAVYRY